MKPYSKIKFRMLYIKNKLEALKYVYIHNSHLVMRGIYNIPVSITYDNNILHDKIKNITLQSYNQTKITIIRATTSQAAYYYADKSYKVCTLSFADPNQCGGLYKQGFVNTETELCQTCPVLYNSLRDTKIYPFVWHEKIIYTPNVLLCRNSRKHYEYYEKHAVIDIISGALPKTIATKTDAQKIFENIQKVFIIGSIHNNNVIILGAWGCELKNNSKLIAKLFHKLIQKYKNMYKIICFAIPDDYNYEIFRSELTNCD